MPILSTVHETVKAIRERVQAITPRQVLAASLILGTGLALVAGYDFTHGQHIAQVFSSLPQVGSLPIEHIVNDPSVAGVDLVKPVNLFQSIGKVIQGDGFQVTFKDLSQLKCVGSMTHKLGVLCTGNGSEFTDTGIVASKALNWLIQRMP